MSVDPDSVSQRSRSLKPHEAEFELLNPAQNTQAMAELADVGDEVEALLTECRHE